MTIWKLWQRKDGGVCYTTNSFGKPLRNIESDERSYIIENYYRPHHKRLTESVKLELDSHGKSLIIDCHSFSNIPLPHEDSKDIPRPDICIGVDSFHTPDDLVQFTKQYFENLNYIVKINDPFSGTIIPMDYYQKDKRVKGIMIELNRDLYKNDFEMVQLNIQNFLEKIQCQI